MPQEKFFVNHIHWLVQDENGRNVIPKSIQLVAGRTGQEFNNRKKRKGSFWEDRYHATAIKTGEQLLHHADYHQYEVSAFCRPGYESRHNLNYWGFGDYVGLGAGAHGKISRQDGQIVRTQRTRRPADYLALMANGAM